MNESDTKTVVLDDEDSNLISVKLAAVNNDVRLSILEILRDFEVVNKTQENTYKKGPLYSREINGILLNNYNIHITPQMLGQHLKQLLEAGLIEEVIVKKEVPNKIGKRRVKSYVLKEDAFEDLFLEINFFSDNLLSFLNLFKFNQRFSDGNNCILTVFNGADKGKTFKVNENDTVCIGRADGRAGSDSSDVILDESYSTVSKVSKPHLKLFFEEGCWYVVDEGSSNGTYVCDKEVPKGRPTKLKSNSFLKLSRGNGGAVIYCSF